jgi:hypothetical protein
VGGGVVRALARYAPAAIAGLLGWAFVWLTLYIAGSIGNGSWSPAQWGENARGLIGTLGALASVFAAVFTVATVRSERS